MANGSRLQAYLLLAAVVALWGINWPIMKAGLNYISPLWFATARVILGGGCLFALLGAQKRLRLPGRSDLPALLSVGMVLRFDRDARCSSYTALPKRPSQVDQMQRPAGQWE